MTQQLPVQTRCQYCHHALSFHLAGPCKSAGCQGRGKHCQEFIAPAGQDLYPAAPERAQLIAALDTLVTVIQRAPASPRARTAAQLTNMIKDLPSLGRAVTGADRPLLDILTACRNPTAAPQDAEVAPNDDEDAQHTPDPDV